MFRGYKCVNKDAKKILETLGFDPKLAIRGWVLLRKGNERNKPCQMHALINHDTDGTQYIDVHSDFLVNGEHVIKRGRRTRRWNQIFKQIDHDEKCDAGCKLLVHYIGLKDALVKYHEGLTNAEGKERQELSTGRSLLRTDHRSMV